MLGIELETLYTLGLHAPTQAASPGKDTRALLAPLCWWRDFGFSHGNFWSHVSLYTRPFQDRDTISLFFSPNVFVFLPLKEPCMAPGMKAALNLALRRPMLSCWCLYCRPWSFRDRLESWYLIYERGLDVCAHGPENVPHACMEARGRLSDSVLSFHYVGFSDRTQDVRLGSKGFRPLSHQPQMGFGLCDLGVSPRPSIV